MTQKVLRAKDITPKAVIEQALTQPGTIAGCYSLFRDYSINNTVSFAMQLKAHGRAIAPVKAGKQWVNGGFITEEERLKHKNEMLWGLLPVFNEYTIKDENGKPKLDENGEPVIGASVVVKGTTIGTVTDFDGNFTLDVPSNGKQLEISYVGMKTKQVSVASNINAVLESDSQALDEVVVTGYGVQKKASFTGAASIIGEDVLSKKTDANFVKALEGSVPGVQMNNSSSMPGVWGSIYVRGRGSLNSGTQPLYVIDGMPIDSDTDKNSLNSESNNQLDPMSTLNPSDIENITVLKDAAATAIYGSRAANGVIIVTTKKGKEGKFNINLDIKQGFVSMANNNMDFANAQQSMNLFANGLAASNPDRYTIESAYNYLADDYFGWDRKSSYDWMDAITRKGYYQDYNLNLQGKQGNTGYYAS